MDDGVTLPARRASHKQPSGTLGPKLLSGHLTAVQLKEKYGAEDVAVTEPEKPARQTQPSATLMPVLLVGQPTGSQDTTCCEVEFRGENPGSQEQSPETHMKPQEETKKGSTVDALTEPCSGEVQIHFSTTLSPSLFGGHATGWQVLT